MGIKAKQKDVMATYKFPNGMVVTFDFKGHQITELQGRWTQELENKITERSSDQTDWNGFGMMNLSIKQIKSKVIAEINSLNLENIYGGITADNILRFISKLSDSQIQEIRKHYLNENELS